VEDFWTHSGIATVTFIVTNVDDLLLLSFYFAHPAYRTRNIVIGQYAGVFTLILISLSGFLLGRFVSDEWLGLLGLVPVALGIKQLVTRGNEDESGAAEIGSGNQWLSVAFITIANGGDNIGVYTPLFATLSPSLLFFYIAIFSALILVLCALAYYLVKHPGVKSAFSKYGHLILPVFLILLGIWIFIEAGTHRLFTGA
jgi:cadmium resistance protein CadD (predicted permease)